jgi:hypothetical protein
MRYPKVRYALVVMLSVGLSQVLSAHRAVSQLRASLPEVWLRTGAHQIEKAPRWRGIRDDYGEMWSANAPWQTVSRDIQVAFLPPANVAGASDEDLQSLLRDAKRRNLALAVETAFLARDASCDARTEAHAPRQDIINILEKIRRNGGVIDYIAMDEPYYYGHRDAAGCRQSASELASNIADNVQLARRYFPGVRVGDIEVVNASAVWTNELENWATAYEKATGEPLAFMHIDVSWSQLAIQNLVNLSGVRCHRP